jgi:hypothetical protein
MLQSSQQDLAQFGYIPDVKVKNFKNCFIFWLLLAGTCCRNLGNKKYFFSKSQKLGQFFSQKSFICVKIIFFRLKKCENSPPPVPPPPPQKQKTMTYPTDFIFLFFQRIDHYGETLVEVHP